MRGDFLIALFFTQIIIHAKLKAIRMRPDVHLKESGYLFLCYMKGIVKVIWPFMTFISLVTPFWKKNGAQCYFISEFGTRTGMNFRSDAAPDLLINK
jgi:hypothetical protein